MRYTNPATQQLTGPVGQPDLVQILDVERWGRLAFVRWLALCERLGWLTSVGHGCGGDRSIAPQQPDHQQDNEDNWQQGTNNQTKQQERT